MSIAAPWDCPKADEWDSMTVKDFVDQTCWFQLTESFTNGVVRAVFATEPENVSLLYFLWYIKCGAGLYFLCTVYIINLDSISL